MLNYETSISLERIQLLMSSSLLALDNGDLVRIQDLTGIKCHAILKAKGIRGASGLKKSAAIEKVVTDGNVPSSRYTVNELELRLGEHLIFYGNRLVSMANVSSASLRGLAFFLQLDETGSKAEVFERIREDLRGGLVLSNPFDSDSDADDDNQKLSAHNFEEEEKVKLEKIEIQMCKKKGCLIKTCVKGTRHCSQCNQPGHTAPRCTVNEH